MRIAYCIILQITFTVSVSAHILMSNYTHAVGSINSNFELYYEKNQSFPEDFKDILEVEGGIEISHFLNEPVEPYIVYFQDSINLPTYRRSRILALMSKPEGNDILYCFLFDPTGRVNTDVISLKYLNKLGIAVPRMPKSAHHHLSTLEDRSIHIQPKSCD